MNIAYIGGGFVGTCSAAVAAGSGHTVLVYDIDVEKIKKLSSGDRDTIHSCLFEEGLGELLVRHKDRITFTTDKEVLAKFFDTVEVVFMCLPTPEIGETGESNLSFYNAAAQDIARLLKVRLGGAQTSYVVLVNKSTVPVDMVDATDRLMREAGVENYGVVSNPEFLVEGKAIQGSLKPERVVIGATKERDFLVMRQVYQRFYDSPDSKYIEVNPQEAAAGKLLANFYLFNKLAVCFDVIGRTCEAFPSVHFENIRRILTSDPRIGSWGFYDSLYAGGSCFIKDARSLAHQLQTKGTTVALVNETYLANKRQLELFIGRAESEARFSWAGASVALLGVAFKRDTNDIRNSPAIDIARFALDHDCRELRVYDPVAGDQFAKLFPADDRTKYFSHEFGAVQGADVIIITSDWPQFRGLADVLMTEVKTRPLIMDGRRMLQHRYQDLQQAGFTVLAVGSPALLPN